MCECIHVSIFTSPNQTVSQILYIEISYKVYNKNNYSIQIQMLALTLYFKIIQVKYQQSISPFFLVKKKKRKGETKFSQVICRVIFKSYLVINLGVNLEDVSIVCFKELKIFYFFQLGIYPMKGYICKSQKAYMEYSQC